MASVEMTIWVCDDCLVYIENGDSEGEEPTTPGWMDDLYKPTVHATDEPSDEFSRTPCEWCGTLLAGRRSQMVVLSNGWVR